MVVIAHHVAGADVSVGFSGFGANQANRLFSNRESEANPPGFASVPGK
jgi:hypothetical protein